MNRTNRCYVSFSSRGTTVWGAHARRVLAMVPRHRELFPGSFQRTHPNGRKNVSARAPKLARGGACAPRNAVDASSLFIK
jgi:hypothetical protein